MQFVGTEVRGQLNAGDDTHAEPFASGAGFGKTVDRVVIGQGNGIEGCGARRFNHLGGRQRPVGRRTVHLQIDELWRGRGARRIRGVHER